MDRKIIRTTQLDDTIGSPRKGCRKTWNVAVTALRYHSWYNFLMQEIKDGAESCFPHSARGSTEETTILEEQRSQLIISSAKSSRSSKFLRMSWSFLVMVI